jgi:hypothetical protein
MWLVVQAGLEGVKCPTGVGPRLPLAGLRASPKLALSAITLGGAALLGAVVLRYPAGGGVPWSPGLLLAFDAAKVPAFLRALLVLLALNLAAWPCGGLVYRLLGGPAGHHPGLDALRRLALGLLVLADLFLLLAALHLLHVPLLLALGGGLAVVGAGQAALALRGRALPLPRALWRNGLVIGAALALALTAGVALCAAHMPDYGWDAFTYHLALPERYLFENRIVVAPLFPHTAFPLTIEMLYGLVLAADPGPAAKLLHAELGGLVAATVWTMASRHARRAAVLGLLVLLADPLFHWELGVAYTDLGAAAFAILALASLQEWREHGSPVAWRLCAVLCGACVATRYTAGAVPLAVLAALWMAPGAWRVKLRHSLVLGLLATAVLAPWLVRNAALTGNPIAPVLQRFFYAPGQEYFDPLALEQQVAFAHGVGYGRGPLQMALLPLNLTARVDLENYRGFGFRIGPLYVIGLAAALAFTAARRAPALRLFLPVFAVLVLAWFLSAQEPRYLLPALALAAVMGGVGLHELGAAAGSRAWAAGPLAVGAVALVHTLAGPAARLPWVYGYALGGLSVEGFRAQEPVVQVAEALRARLGPEDRLLLVYEPRGFFFRGLRYVFAETRDLMQLVHRSGDADALAVQVRELGVSHVLVNANNVARYGTTSVPGYGPAELEQDLRLLEQMLARRSAPLLSERGVVVRRMEWAR